MITTTLNSCHDVIIPRYKNVEQKSQRDFIKKPVDRSYQRAFLLPNAEPLNFGYKTLQ